MVESRHELNFDNFTALRNTEINASLAKAIREFKKVV